MKSRLFCEIAWYAIAILNLFVRNDVSSFYISLTIAIIYSSSNEILREIEALKNDIYRH